MLHITKVDRKKGVKTNKMASGFAHKCKHRRSAWAFMRWFQATQANDKFVMHVKVVHSELVHLALFLLQNSKLQ